MIMNNTFTRRVLQVVVAQIAQTIGWDSIQSTPLELMVDFLHRYLEDLCKVTHRYSEQFGQTQPNLDHLGLAFQDFSIDLQDLGEYVRNVESVPCVLDVPQFPVEKETHLNFLKPGSNEVVHRPVHVHEHLPPMHPDLEDQEKKTPLSESTITNADGSVNNSGVFKRPGDPLESPAMKRTRMMLEEEGRPMREISSVIMTTSGFLSPAREGKLPEARTPIFPSDIGGRSPTPSSFPTVPPEIKSEKKIKKSTSKKTTLGSKKLEKENGKKKDKDGTKSDKPKVKKLASMKETSKLKALKTKAKKVPTIASEGNPKDFANFIQNLFQSSTQNKNKPEDLSWSAPGTSKEPDRVPEPNLLEGKLLTEPDKQKLNIFKKISKVKEEKSEKVERDEVPRENTYDVIIDEVIERQWTSAPSTSHTALTTGSSDIEEDVYISDTLSPPGTPSTPKTPELPSKLDKLGGRKRKKDKSKSKSKKPKSMEQFSKKPRIIEQIDLERESMDRPKTPEVAPVALFPFAPHFPPVPGLIPPPLHPMFSGIPNLPFMKQNLPPLPPTMTHPAMPNLPIPPPSFMQASTSVVQAPPPPREEPPTFKSPEVILPIAEKPVVEKEKKTKEAKKEDGSKKPKKKKLKKEKIKSKEKGEKKKDKDEKKVKDKEKSKEKKEKKKEREREERPEQAVPKLTLKLGLDSSRPSTPEQSRKIVIKPVVKKDEVAAVEPKRAVSPELARFSALVTRQPKKSKPSDASTSLDVSPVEVKSEFKTKDVSKKSAHSTMTTKETVAFYHHESSGSAGSSKPPRGSPARAGRGSIPGDDAGNKIWICPACKGPDDGSPMIGCDDCDAWYHWVCVGIQVPPDDKEDWYCRDCIQRKQETLTSKKKLKKKNKI